MTVKELFDFVTDLTITSNNIEGYLDQAMEVAANRTLEEVTEQEKVDAEVSKLFWLSPHLKKPINVYKPFILVF